MIGIAAIGFFFIVEMILLKFNRKKIISDLILLLLGMALITILFSLYFLYHNALLEFLFYNIWFNFTVLFTQTYNFIDYSYYFMKHQAAFVLITVLGLILMGYDLMNLEKLFSEKRIIIFVFLITIITSLSASLGLYQQFYLIFLPLLSIVASYGVFTIQKFLKNALSPIFSCLLLSFIVATLFTSLVSETISKTPKIHSEKLFQQKALTNFVLSHSKRTDPLFYTWTDTGGYIFNADIQYFWMTSLGYDRHFSQLSGYNIFGQTLVNLIEQKKVDYLISDKNELIKVLSKEAYTHIENNFYSHDNYKSLWVRKNKLLTLD